MHRCNHPERRGPQPFSLLETMMGLTLILLAATIPQPREHHAAGARGGAADPWDWPWSSWRFYYLNDASIMAMDHVP